jgi:hypothetical protein
VFIDPRDGQHASTIDPYYGQRASPIGSALARS